MAGWYGIVWYGMVCYSMAGWYAVCCSSRAYTGGGAMGEMSPLRPVKGEALPPPLELRAIKLKF